MQVADCLSIMSKLHLSRTIDSILQENIPKGDEEQLKEQIIQNIESLISKDRINKALNLVEMNRANRFLTRTILRLLLEEPDLSATEEALWEGVQEYETKILEKAASDSALAFADKYAIDVYRTVLEVALEDEDISRDEFALLFKLREKLKISRLDHRILESQLGMFPKPENKLHVYDEFKQASMELQKKGILFFCNRAEPCALLVLPEEIAQSVRELLGFEMRRSAQEMMHNTLMLEQLRSVARQKGLPVSGSKQQLSDLLFEAQCKPSEILSVLSGEDLNGICRKLSGVPITGNKGQLVERIIDYFASLTAREEVTSDDPREVYYQYLEELAGRNNNELYRQNIISRDREMEAYFEEGTRYLFEEKLGCELIPMEGTEHADGGVRFPNGELLLWDNKSKEQEYKFPQSHVDQFLRYIRNSVQRVNVFLVIVPEVVKEAAVQAMQLKYKNKTDTDVAVITAHDLKYVAENWHRFAKNEHFDLNVFNATGILDRAVLEQRMEILL